MRILFINDKVFNPILGGIESVTDVITRALLKRGHVVFYLCNSVSDPKELDYDFPAKLFLLPKSGEYSNVENQDYCREVIMSNNIDIIIRHFRQWQIILRNEIRKQPSVFWAFVRICPNFVMSFLWALSLKQLLSLV